MAPLTDDCFALSGRLIPLREVTPMIQSRFACAVVAEAVSLTDAGDRALAEDVMAPISVPSETHSAVDGSAVHFDDLSSPQETVLPLRGRSAGHLIPAPLPRGYGVRMFTGALMPDGADAVLMQEDRVAGDDAVRIRAGIKPGANHRLAGENVVAGETILLAGRPLGPGDRPGRIA
jgi:molybdopterin molybdotransferase